MGKRQSWIYPPYQDVHFPWSSTLQYPGGTSAGRLHCSVALPAVVRRVSLGWVSWVWWCALSKSTIELSTFHFVGRKATKSSLFPTRFEADKCNPRPEHFIPLRRNALVADIPFDVLGNPLQAAFSTAHKKKKRSGREESVPSTRCQRPVFVFRKLALWLRLGAPNQVISTPWRRHIDVAQSRLDA